DRYTQVKDYYTFAIQTVIDDLYTNSRTNSITKELDQLSELEIGQWHIKIQRSKFNESITELIPASSMKFNGFMGTYRQDGFGAEFVGLSSPNKDKNKSFSQMETPPVSAILKFSGSTANEIINTKKADLILLDPFEQDSITVEDKKVPLAANFTASYGYWLAHSDFAKQSFQTLFGTEKVIDKPYIYLMQPYDPNRRIIFMVHGLASSPEAWVNLANELVSNKNIRDHYQVWNVYYPTNAPIIANLLSIKNIFEEALSYYDPERKNKASDNIVIIGHSMGGIIARLIVSDSKDELIELLIREHHIKPENITPELKKELTLKALPEIKRAIFLAAPHRGTDIAGQKLGRLASKFVSIPINVLSNTGNIFGEVLNTMGIIQTDLDTQPKKVKTIPNSIDNLDKNDPFIQTSAQFPISPNVTYHSIIANRFDDKPLQESDDGLVPYWSSHLEGAASEKVIHSWHSVQEKPEAMSEIIRILYEDMRFNNELNKNE
ncbi:MAG: alpha/beta hydrolase, partial [Neisseriaceae bacterium]|nr:alpha/beta hydrolase [Neisseriaceae bacterium]